MSGVFQIIDLPHPLTARRVCTPACGAGGGHTRWWRGGRGVNILEDARHCSVLYICKYFVVAVNIGGLQGVTKRCRLSWLTNSFRL